MIARARRFFESDVDACDMLIDRQVHTMESWKVYHYGSCDFARTLSVYLDMVCFCGSDWFALQL